MYHPELPALESDRRLIANGCDDTVGIVVSELCGFGLF